MDMTGERRIPAPRAAVWDALNDPLVLQASIPGCQSLDKLSDRAMKAAAAVKIGPISARFNGTVTLDDLDPPNGYTISGEGQGGAAGFARGGAKVRLSGEAPDETVLSYEVHAQVGGKIAQLGARLIDASAKQMADQFFDRFTALVAPAEPVQIAPAVAQQDLAGRAVRDGAEPAMAARGEPAATQPSGTGTDPLAAAGVHAPTAVGPRPGGPTAARSAPARPALPPSGEPARISLWSLVPREPFGVPLIAWLSIAAWLVVLLLITGNLL